MMLDLDAIRACLEGAIPGVLATCGSDGLPNVSYVSEVEYVDARHLALSFQFFNKTRRNVLANPAMELLVVHPEHGGMYRLTGRYLRTESEGPLFERMKAKLAGIASHTGMEGVFVLRGADVYAIDTIEAVGAAGAPVLEAGPNRLAALRRSAQRLAGCGDLEALVEVLLDSVVQDFGIAHAMLLLLDTAGKRLVTIASRGYAQGGAGAETPLGAGVVGVAAQAGTPIRIHHATLEYSYARTLRAAQAASGLEQEIPLPGLAHPGSQLALPLQAGAQVLGVLFVESPEERRFSWDDEDALMSLAAQAAGLLRGLLACAELPEEPAPALSATDCPAADAAPLRVRYYEADGSVFLDDQYLIKGVAGALLWKLLREHQASGRCDFTIRELRLASDLGLPGAGDNLDTRLLLLTRRLVEREACLRLQRSGRGRFRLCLSRGLQLQAVPR
jgi:uncharacterized protein YigA (DUF484 family)